MIPSRHRKDSKEQREIPTCETILPVARDSTTKSSGRAKLQLKRRKLGLGLSSPAERERESIHPVPEFSELEARTSFFSSLYYYF